MSQSNRGAAPSATNDLDTVAARNAAFTALGVRTFASLSAMNSATGQPDGTVAMLGSITTTNGYTLLPSVWSYEQAKWYPQEPLRVSSASANADLVGYLTTYTGLAFRPYSTTTSVYTPATAPLAEYIYIGTTTGFLLWRGDFSASVTVGTKYAARSGYVQTFSVRGQEAYCNFAYGNASGSAPAAADTLATIPANYRPANTAVLNGLSTPGSSVTNQPAVGTVSSAGVVALLGPTASSSTTAAASTIALQGAWIRVMPTA